MALRNYVFLYVMSSNQYIQEARKRVEETLCQTEQKLTNSKTLITNGYQPELDVSEEQTQDKLHILSH